MIILHTAKVPIEAASFSQINTSVHSNATAPSAAVQLPQRFCQTSQLLRAQEKLLHSLKNVWDALCELPAEMDQ